MAITVSEFDRARHLDAAALLLAERHVRDRERDPRFPAAYEIPPACRPLIESALTEFGATGVVASEGGEVVGFAVMSPFLAQPMHMTAAFFPPRSASVSYSNHAAKGGMEHEVYREMYAALAADFVERGYFDHYAYIAPRDKVVEEAFVSLGFGRTLTAALRGVEPVEAGLIPGAGSAELHAAGAEDASVVFALNDELNAHHARAPIFWPMLREPAESSHQFTRDLLADPKTNAHWVAYGDGKPLGMNTFMAPVWITPMLTPEKTIYLYQGIVSEEARRGGLGRTILARGIDWAREQGYQHVALHFASPNVSGARFWQSQGFAPIEHRMARHVDERIAWAR
jgi:GNAT superfamily N-acetyltransferase